MSTPLATTSEPRGGALRHADRSLTLLAPDGSPVRLGDLAGTTLVVQFVRYFGCLPCQVYLRGLDGQAAALAEVGARAVAIGGSADYQARWLRDNGVSMPLLLDPQGLLRAWAGLGDLSGRQLLDPHGIRRYLGAVAAGVPPRRPTVDVKRSPGIAILDADLALRWVYEGGSLGDYPSLDDVVAAAANVGGRTA